MITRNDDEKFIIYPEKAYKLGIPEKGDDLAIAYRLQIIWHEFGEDAFNAIFELSMGSYENLKTLNLETFALCEIDIFYSYLTRVTHLLNEDYEIAKKEYHVEAIFPLKNALNSKEDFKIEKNISGELIYSRSISSDFEMGLSEFVRAKLAIHELLFLFTNNANYLIPLLYFSKSYIEDSRAKEFLFESNFLETSNLIPWATKRTEILYNKISFMNYPHIYNLIIAETDSANLNKKFNTNLSETLLNESPKKVVFNILKDKGLFKGGWELFEKNQKYHDDLYGLARTKGRKPKGHLEHPSPTNLSNSQYHAFDLYNYCLDESKYEVIRATDYQKCFDKYLDQIYFETPSGEVAPDKLMNLLSNIKSQKP